MSSICANDVRMSFLRLLGRLPESSSVVAEFLAMGDIETMDNFIQLSPEYLDHRRYQQVDQFDTILSMVRAQTSNWLDYARDHNAMEKRFSDLNMCPEVFLYKISSSKVQICEKFKNSSEGIDRSIEEIYRKRSKYYLTLLSEALINCFFENEYIVAIRIDDEAIDYADIPVFSFQKTSGQKNMLLPDFEFVSMEYHEEQRRLDLPFDDKMDRVIFAGATTGLKQMTLDVVMSSKNARIRAARFFKNSSCVDFYLPNIVQCADEVALQFLALEGFGQGRITWEESFKYKYIISMDGNGATCSRIAIILASNSVPMVYDSDKELYYTKFIQPWHHYLPVGKDEDILTIVDGCDQKNLNFRYVANAGKRFAEEYLCRKSISLYVQAIICEYVQIFYG